MTVDAHANFAVSSVVTPPSPSTSGLSLTVSSGEGSRFPATPFNAAVGPAGQTATPANSEVIRVTTITVDTLTIVRQQESSSARAIAFGDQIGATITTKTLTDIEASLLPTSTLVTLTGTSAGTAVSSMSFTGANYKQFLVFLNGYENTTGAAQTIAFPTVFTTVASVTTDASAGSTASLTTLTLPTLMGTTKSGLIIVEGY